MNMSFTRRSAIVAFVTAILTVHPAAEEGMWTFDHPPTAAIQQRYGFAVTPDWLTHLRLASVRFNDGGSGSFVWNRNQHPYGKRRDYLEHFGVGLVMAIESGDAEVSAGRSGYSETLKAHTAGLLDRLSRDRGFRCDVFPVQLDSQAAAL